MEAVYAPVVAGFALGLLCLAVVIRYPGKTIKLPELSHSDIESDSESSSDDDLVNDEAVSSEKAIAVCAATPSPKPPAAGASSLRRRQNRNNTKTAIAHAGPETAMKPHEASTSGGTLAGLQQQPGQSSGVRPNPTSELQRAFFNTDDPVVVRKMYQAAKRKADKQVKMMTLGYFKSLYRYCGLQVLYNGYFP